MSMFTYRSQREAKATRGTFIGREIAPGLRFEVADMHTYADFGVEVEVAKHSEGGLGSNFTRSVTRAAVIFHDAEAMLRAADDLEACASALRFMAEKVPGTQAEERVKRARK